MASETYVNQGFREAESRKMRLNKIPHIHILKIITLQFQQAVRLWGKRKLAGTEKKKKCHTFHHSPTYHRAFSVPPTVTSKLPIQGRSFQNLLAGDYRRKQGRNGVGKISEKRDRDWVLDQRVYE